MLRVSARNLPPIPSPEKPAATEQEQGPSDNVVGEGGPETVTGEISFEPSSDGNGHSNGHATVAGAALLYHDPADDDPAGDDDAVALAQPIDPELSDNGDDDPEESGTSDEFDGDGGPESVAASHELMAELEAEKAPDPLAVKHLLAKILATQSVPAECQKIIEGDFDDYEEEELYEVLFNVSEPITLKKVLNYPKTMSLSYDLESLKELRAQDDPQVTAADLIDDIKRLHIHRLMDQLHQQQSFYVDQYPEKLATHLKKIQVVDDSRKKKPNAAQTWISAGDLADKDVSVKYLVEDVVVEGQPMIIGGHSKTLKTLIGQKLAIALASGTPFMDHFAVPEAVTVGFCRRNPGRPP